MAENGQSERRCASAPHVVASFQHADDTAVADLVRQSNDFARCPREVELGQSSESVVETIVYVAVEAWNDKKKKKKKKYRRTKRLNRDGTRVTGETRFLVSVVSNNKDTQLGVC